MVKPRRGAGGWRNAVVRDETGCEAWESLYPDVPFIRQELAAGHARERLLHHGRYVGARAVAANEQVLRGSGESAFGFCGSITPFGSPAGAADDGNCREDRCRQRLPRHHRDRFRCR